jgi:hypothetical protein
MTSPDVGGGMSKQQPSSLRTGNGPTVSPVRDLLERRRSLRSRLETALFAARTAEEREHVQMLNREVRTIEGKLRAMNVKF